MKYWASLLAQSYGFGTLKNDTVFWSTETSLPVQTMSHTRYLKYILQTAKWIIVLLLWCHFWTWYYTIHCTVMLANAKLNESVYLSWVAFILLRSNTTCFSGQCCTAHRLTFLYTQLGITAASSPDVSTTVLASLLECFIKLSIK